MSTEFKIGFLVSCPSRPEYIGRIGYLEDDGAYVVFDSNQPIPNYAWEWDRRHSISGINNGDMCYWFPFRELKLKLTKTDLGNDLAI